jgi:hypothetical protein
MNDSRKITAHGMGILSRNLPLWTQENKAETLCESGLLITEPQSPET